MKNETVRSYVSYLPLSDTGVYPPRSVVHTGSVVVVPGAWRDGGGNRDSGGGAVVGEAPTRAAYSRTPFGQSIVIRDTHRDRGITRADDTSSFRLTPVLLFLFFSPSLCRFFPRVYICTCTYIHLCTSRATTLWRKETNRGHANTLYPLYIRNLCIYGCVCIYIHIHIHICIHTYI